MCGCLSCVPYWRTDPQPRHVPWLGIEPATLWFTGQLSIHWATPARGKLCFLCDNFSFILLDKSHTYNIFSLGLPVKQLEDNTVRILEYQLLTRARLRECRVLKWFVKNTLNLLEIWQSKIFLHSYSKTLFFFLQHPRFSLKLFSPHPLLKIFCRKE